MSERTSSASPRNCSGEAKPGVPRIVPRSVALSPRLDVATDRPKSPMSTRPSPCTKQFDGLMSRWRIPIAAAASRPATTCRIASTAAADASGVPSTRQILQRAAGRELHRDDRKPLDLGRAEDVDGVRMAERRGEPSLAKKPFALLVVAEAAAQDLHRDPAAALGLLGFVDLSHPAFAERTDDHIWAEALAGGKQERHIGRKAGARSRSAKTTASRRPTTTSRRSRCRGSVTRPVSGREP